MMSGQNSPNNMKKTGPLNRNEFDILIAFQASVSMATDVFITNRIIAITTFVHPMSVIGFILALFNLNKILESDI